MKKSSRQRYQRLPGKKSGLYRRGRLWLGKDHLLSVDSNIYQESYQRYYFKDIQGIIIRKTAKGKILNTVVGVLAMLAGMKSLAAWGDSDLLWLWFWGLAAGILLLILLGNMVFGATCVCHIQTPISTNELPTLHRLGTARKVRDRIRAQVEHEQGRLSREQIQQTVPPPQSRLPVVEEVKQWAGKSKNGEILSTEGLSTYSGWAHWLLMVLCLIMAGFLILYLFFNGPAMAGAGLLVGAILLIVNIIALAKQANSSVPTEIKTTSWSIMVTIFLALGVDYFGMLVTMIRGGQVKEMFNQWTLFISMAQIRPIDVPFLSAVYIIAALCLGVAAIFGSIALLGWRQRVARTIDADPAPATIQAAPGGNQ